MLTYTTANLPSPDGAETCTVSSAYIAQMPDGSRQQLQLSLTGRKDGTRPPGFDDPCDGQFVEVASSSLAGWAASTPPLQDSLWQWHAVTVTSPDGAVVQFPNGALPASGILASSLTDRNGNAVAYAVNAGGGLTLTDTLGRVFSTSGFAQPTDTITVPGMADTYAVAWATEPASGTVSVVGDPASSPCPNTTAAIHGGAAVTSIATPEGTYTFSYDPYYGVVDRITYPNGGYIRYVWGVNAQSEPAQLQQWNGSSYQACYARFDNPVITDRYVSPDGVHETEHESFQYSTTWSAGIYNTWSAKTTTVTDTDTVANTRRTLAYVYAPLDDPLPVNAQTYVAGQTPLESTVTTEDGSGTTLRVLTESWSGYPFLPTDQQTALNGVNADEIKNTYNANARLTERDEYDYPNNAEALARKTTLAYAALANNIVDRPSNQTVYGPDGATIAAESNYGYDAHGNQTSLSRWVSGSTWLNSSFTYDAYGNRLTATDPANCTTTYGYANAWSPAGGPSGNGDYVTAVTDCLNHSDSYTWNFAGGTLATHIDQNSNTTSYSYEGWDRLNQINYPDLGETTFTYSPTSATLETRRLLDSSGDWMDHLDTFDGLGRPIIAATETSLGQWSRADTEYDGFGREAYATYPYYSASAGAPANYAEPGDSFLYDALDRETLLTHSDGTTLITNYAGRATETEDEGDGANRITRIRQEDGLGRLAAVCEVITSAPPTEGPGPAGCGLDSGPTLPAATGYLTTYTHDALGNLTQVAQGAEARSFAYDGLSRLLGANNPETGTTSYLYDNDAACAAPNSFPGDLVGRTDARGIRTCYQYDPLHRVTQKNYSDGTPLATFAYDASSELGVQLSNTVGRLAEECTGGCSSTTELFGYDKMGRENYTDACAPAGCAAGAYASTWETFDLAGDPTGSEVGLPGPHYTSLSGTVDLAGRPTSTTSTANGTLISGVAYDAWGHELSATLGNGEAETRAYDSRGRATAIADGSDYSYAVPANGYAPNGDILAFTDSATGGFQDSYNDLNQLATALCTPNCNSASAAYAYDRYGNRWSESANFTPPAAPENATFNNAANHLDGYSYDAAGNLLNDGVHAYAYDAENRLLSVDGGATASYAYDAEGRRVHEEVGGVVKEYLYAPVGQELSIVDGNQNLLQGETYFGGRYLGTATPSWFNYAYADGQGTVRKRSNGELDSNWPFGEFANYQNGVSPIHFTGKLRDSETNLDYFGARYYSSQLGRWMTPDWSPAPAPIPYANLANPQSLNLYSYVLNNPATATDPDGHICFLGIGNTCGKKAKLQVKEGGVAAAGAADAALGGELDVRAVLAGLEAAGDAVTAGATTAAEGALGVAGGLLTFTEPLNAGEDQILAKRDEQEAGQSKVAKPGVSGKEGAKDVPSWALGQKPRVGESGREFATRLMDQKYGQGNWGNRVGPGKEFNQIQKWGDRAFANPPGSDL